MTYANMSHAPLQYAVRLSSANGDFLAVVETLPALFHLIPDPFDKLHVFKGMVPLCQFEEREQEHTEEWSKWWMFNGPSKVFSCFIKCECGCVIFVFTVPHMKAL